MATANTRLEILIQAVNQAQAVIKEIENELAGMGDAAKKANDAVEAGSQKGTNAVNAQTVAAAKLGASWGTVAVTAVSTMATVAVALSKVGATSMETEGVLKNLAGQAGMTSKTLLDAMDRAAAGTVSRMDLMQTANRLLVTGFKANVDQMAGLMAIAKDRSDATGMSTAAAFERITTAVSYMSPRMLKSMGILIDASDAYSAYAAQMGIAKDQMTETEQQQAILNAILAKGTSQLGSLAGAAGNADDAWERLGATTSNVVEKMGRQFTGLGEVIANVGNFALNEVLQGAGDSLGLLGTMFEASVNGTRAYNIVLNQGGTIADAEIARRAAMVAVTSRVTDANNTDTEAIIARNFAAQQAELTSGKFITTLRQQNATLIDERTQLRDNQLAWQAYTAERSKAMQAFAAEVDKIGKDLMKNILKPTAVTGLDIDLSALDQYSAKWDEMRRRFDAFAGGTPLDKYGKEFQDFFLSLNMSAEQASLAFKDFSLFADMSPDKLIKGMNLSGGMKGIMDAYRQQIKAMMGEENFMDTMWGELKKSLDPKEMEFLLKKGIDKFPDLAKAAGITDLKVKKAGDFDAVLADAKNMILNTFPPELETTVFVTYAMGGGGGKPPAGGNPPPGAVSSETGGKFGETSPYTAMAAGGYGTVTKSGLVWIDRGEKLWASGVRGQVPPPGQNVSVSVGSVRNERDIQRLARAIAKQMKG